MNLKKFAFMKRQIISFKPDTKKKRFLKKAINGKKLMFLAYIVS